MMKMYEIRSESRLTWSKEMLKKNSKGLKHSSRTFVMVDSNEEEKVDEVFAKIIGCQDELSGLLAKIMVKSTSALVNSYLGRTLRMVSFGSGYHPRRRRNSLKGIGGGC